MRLAGAVIAALFVLLGAIWVGQGLGYIKGSFMTGESMWAWIGAALVIVGVVLGAVSFYWKRAPGRT
jgi:hypothetical protein